MLMPSIFGEDLFDDFMRFPMERGITYSNNNSHTALMRTDIRDAGENYELDIDLPGYSKDDIKLQLKDGYLTIQAAREENHDEKDEKGKYIRRERYSGQCSRSFFVGKKLVQDDIHAKYEDGILKISFPKEEPKKEIEENRYIAIEG
jgi:HSP20 family molecular chaperone IbpA